MDFLKHLKQLLRPAPGYYATATFRMLKIMISSCTLHSVQLCCYTFIAKQKMYRLLHSTWYIPSGHCLYYHRHYHLHQFTSVEDLLATTIASDQLYWVTTAFSNFLKRASTVLLLQWTFYQVRKAVISSRHNQLFCRYFGPFFHATFLYPYPSTP